MKSTIKCESTSRGVWICYWKTFQSKFFFFRMYQKCIVPPLRFTSMDITHVLVENMLFTILRCWHSAFQIWHCIQTDYMHTYYYYHLKHILDPGDILHFFFLLIYHPNCHRHTISLFNRELFNAFVFIADAYKITSTWRVPPIGSLQISQWHERWRWRGEDMGRTDYYEMERESESIFFYDCVGNDVFHLYVLHL